MPDLSDLRALLDDHQQKDAGLTVDIQLCLKRWLAEDLAAAQRQRVDLVSEHSDRVSGADTTDIDELITRLESDLERAMITLHFRAISEHDYRMLLHRHPDAGPRNPAAWSDFLVDLAEGCYSGCEYVGKTYGKADMPLSEIRSKITFGEWEPITTFVLNLNRTTVDLPFLSTRSGASPTS